MPGILKLRADSQPQQTLCVRADIHKLWGYCRLLLQEIDREWDTFAKPSVTLEAPRLGLISVAVTRYLVCGVV